VGQRGRIPAWQISEVVRVMLDWRGKIRVAYCTGHYGVPLSIFCPTCGAPNHCSKCVDEGRCSIVTPPKFEPKISITFQSLTGERTEVPIEESRRWQQMNEDERRKATEPSRRPRPLKIFCHKCERERTTLSKDLVCPVCRNNTWTEKSKS
jgi:hypothetical protein